MQQMICRLPLVANLVLRPALREFHGHRRLCVSRVSVCSRAHEWLFLCVGHATGWRGLKHPQIKRGTRSHDMPT